MKEIKSFFEEPKNYLYGSILGVTSFSGLTFWMVENGMSLRDPASVFKTFMCVFFGVPALLPFYHLTISGRNRPREFSILVLALGVVLCILLSNTKVCIIIAFATWICLFIFMFSIGKSIRLSSDDSVWIRENAMMEIALIVILLLSTLYFSITYSYKHLGTDINVDKTFESFRRGNILKTSIDSENSLITLERKIYKNGDSHANMMVDYYEMCIALGSDSTISKINGRPSFILTPAEFTQKLSQIRTSSIIYHKTQENFAKDFIKLLRNFQLKGIVLLVMTALFLLLIWSQTVEKGEISDRIRSHFFIIVIIIFPLLRKFEQKDITIEKPFGFSFSEEKNNDRKIEVLLDSISKAQVSLNFRQQIMDEKIDNLDRTVGEVEKKVFLKVNGVLVDENYMRLVDAVTQGMSDATKEQYKSEIKVK